MSKKAYVSVYHHSPDGPRFARYLQSSLSNLGVECAYQEFSSSENPVRRKGALGSCPCMLALVTEDYARAVFDRDSLVHKEARGFD